MTAGGFTGSLHPLRLVLSNDLRLVQKQTRETQEKHPLASFSFASKNCLIKSGSLNAWKL
jgi:hypothetical protein